MAYKSSYFKINLKVFSPNEQLETELAKDLIFIQIIQDFSSVTQSNIRLNNDDKIKFKKFLGCYFIFKFKNNLSEITSFINRST